MLRQPRQTITTIAQVFLPSGFGLAIYFVIFAITALVNQPSSYKDTWRTVIITDWQQSFIYHYGGDVTNLIRTQLAGTIALYVFWGILGLAIFAVGVRLTDNVNELAEDISLRSYIWPKGADRNSALKGFLERLAYRTVMAILLVVYLVKMIPWLSDKWQADTVGLDLTVHTLWHYLGLFFYEALILHGAVVILRFLLLRKRLVEY